MIPQNNIKKNESKEKKTTTERKTIIAKKDKKFVEMIQAKKYKNL